VRQFVVERSNEGRVNGVHEKAEAKRVAACRPNGNPSMRHASRAGASLLRCVIRHEMRGVNRGAARCTVACTPEVSVLKVRGMRGANPAWGMRKWYTVLRVARYSAGGGNC